LDRAGRKLKVSQCVRYVNEKVTDAGVAHRSAIDADSRCRIYGNENWKIEIGNNRLRARSSMDARKAMRTIKRFAGYAALAGIWLLPVLGKAQTSADARTMERLRSQMTTALAAARQRDQAKLKEIGRSWMIPDYELWFKAMFEEGTGAAMASAYGANLESTEKLLPRLLEWLARQEGELVIEDAKTLPKRSDSWCGEKLESLLKSDLALYRVSVGKGDSPGLQGGRVAGDYRRLDCPSLGLAGPPPHPMSEILRVGGNVMAARNIKKVAPVYPREARAAGISGKVLLHAIIGKDGGIQALEVISGPPALKEAALDAVRQWKYQVTFLKGNPVEVDTTIDVLFAINR
jgi:TonB family protein